MKESVKSTKTTIICCIIIGLLLIALAVYTAVSGGDFSFLKEPTKAPTPTTVPTPTLASIRTVGDTEEQLVILSVDTEGKVLRVREPVNGNEFSLYYTGSADIRNRFDQVIAASQIAVGSIAAVSYDKETSRVYRIALSSNYWKLEKKTNLQIDLKKEMLTVEGTNYRCSQKTVVLSGGEFLAPEELQAIDIVNIYGVGDRVFLIELLQGHGQLYLMNETDFIGGSLYVDNEFAAQITAGMALEVREGTYEIAISFGELHGEKTIEITRGGTAIFDAAPFGAEEIQTGRADFIISPEGAELYIDDTYQYFTERILLSYGTHTVMVSLGGYTTWTGSITISSEQTTLTIALAETVTATPTPTAAPTPTGLVDEGEDGGETTLPDSTSDDTPASTDQTGNSDDGTGGTDSSDSSESKDNTGEDTDAEDGNGSAESDANAEGSVTVQIIWYPASVVQIDSVYAGMTDASGILNTVITKGTHVIQLIRTVLDGSTVPATYTVEVDSSTPVLSFPHSS